MDLSGLTHELVSIPSHDDETAVGDVIADWLRTETDAVVRRDEAGNVIARRNTDADGPTLALVGHHDVVPPDESQVDADGQYVLEQRDDRLYGRGTADMKGALAAAMLAFRDAVPPCELVFASFVGEEVGGRGARHAIDTGFSPDYAIVGEGSTGYSAPDVTDVAIAHKGRRASTFTIHGEAAHASEPAAGENAIYHATTVIDDLRTLELPTVSVAGDHLEGTLAVSEIAGGSSWNVIPEECVLTVDERTVPGERAPLETFTSERVEWTVDQDLPPMQCTDDGFAETVLEAASRAQSGTPQLVTKPHATDAGWLAAAGTQCVICGAAEPGEAHTSTESVSLPVLERCYETYRRVVETLTGDVA